MSRLSAATFATALVLFPVSPLSARGTVIEDFETGTVDLVGYPNQDHDPTAWEVTSANTYGGTSYALRIHGNSWKLQSVAPVTLDHGTVWQVAAYIEDLGEMQAFGVSDGVNELLYTFAGSQLPQTEKWWTVYQGAFPREVWFAYLLPLGRDWHTTYGYLPTVTHLIYVNDDDGGGSTGATVFDEIIDVTDDLPVPPAVTIEYTVESTQRVAANLFRATIQFYGYVFDPDSNTHEFHWDFGDGATSAEQNPGHEFLVEADHTYTVGFTAWDPDGLAGHDTCQVTVEPGPGDPPATVNFVGDVMTARSYEVPGGIIDTYGVESIFEPTLSIFGEAADVNVCNLECPFTDRGSPHPTKSVVFRARPENIAGVHYAGVDLVSLGNNHIIDYGEPGMLQTQSLLDSLEIRHSGAGTNSYFALQPTFWTEQGIRMAFLGQCNRTGRQWNYQPFLDAGYVKPGFAYFLPPNLEGVLAETGNLADIVVLQTHSGDEYETQPPDQDPNRPAPVEAVEIEADDPDFRFPIEPTPGDRELRRMALDLGADVLINHHPHVLQGFEVHQGKLIAHSLGNFVFDLYYPETMPTLVLTLEVVKTGIVGYTFVPAWIDDYVPQPASGTLGREIMDRMADYSRPMDALVAVDPVNGSARIHLGRETADSSLSAVATTAPLVIESGYRISPPVELAGVGNLSRILSVSGPGVVDWEVRWGREILWHGGFEDEGATFWDDNTEDEWLDDTVSWAGVRSLALRRDAGDPERVGTDLEKHLPCDPGKRHTARGHVRADNAADAVLMARFYSGRYSSTPLSSTDVGSRVTGTQDWIGVWQNLETPGSGTYFEVRCENGPPASGTGHAWFDELAFVEWEPWVPAKGPIAVPSPNNYRFVQIRSVDPAAITVTVRYQETSYAGNPTSAPGPVIVAGSRPMLRSFPNPFRTGTTVELTLPRSSGPVPVRLDVYDIRGRRVASLFKGRLVGGVPHPFSWNGTDVRGRTVASGVYFTRAEAGGRVETRKLLLLR
jgi:poly-gamma-glutamate capsule biosynthesis protein CapA/YwtB (metallophosphatase superfamily)